MAGHYDLGVEFSPIQSNPMPVSKTRKNKPGLAKQARRKREMYLPLDAESADQLALRFRLALEAARQGRASAANANCLAQTFLIAALIADAGFGELDELVLCHCESGLRAMLRKGGQTGEWQFDERLIGLLTTVVNEHERQLRQTRLQVIVKATEALERAIDVSETPEDLFSSRTAIAGPKRLA